MTEAEAYLQGYKDAEKKWLQDRTILLDNIREHTEFTLVQHIQYYFTIKRLRRMLNLPKTTS